MNNTAWNNQNNQIFATKSNGSFRTTRSNVSCISFTRILVALALSILAQSIILASVFAQPANNANITASEDNSNSLPWVDGTHHLSFDGLRSSISIGKKDQMNGQLTGADIQTIEFMLGIDWNSTRARDSNASILNLATINSAINSDENFSFLLLQLASRNSSGLSFFDSQATSGDLTNLWTEASAIGPNHIALVRSNSEGWDVFVNAEKVGLIPQQSFNPDADDQLTLTLGSIEFVGTISGFRIWSVPLSIEQLNEAANLTMHPEAGMASLPKDNLIVAMSRAGNLEAVPKPRYGVYQATDSEIGIAQPLKVPGVDERRHGLFEREVFFQIAPLKNVADGFTVLSDHGWSIDFIKHENNPFAYIPLDPDNGNWAGMITFISDVAGTLFTVDNVHEGTSPGYLKNGAYYQYLPPHNLGIDDTVRQVQKVGEVWITQNFPQGFQFSRQGCFDIRSMHPSNFQKTGCKNPIFSLPPITSSAHHPDNTHTIPTGWIYAEDEEKSGMLFSTFVDSFEKLGSAYSGGSGQSYNFVGASLEHNENTQRESDEMRESSSSRSFHHYVDRTHAIVVDPQRVYLNPCFISRVIRATGGKAEPPLYYRQAQSEKLAEMWLTPDKCPEPEDLPLSVEELVNLHGTHFAYAITYGARGLKTVNYSSAKLGAFAGSRLDVAHAIGVSIKGTGKKGPITAPLEAGANFTDEESQQNFEDVSQELNSELGTFECYGGAGCQDGEPDATSDQIPVFLHLRRLDRILAPPYFDDPEITINLRKKLSDYLDSEIPQTVDPAPVTGRLFSVNIAEPSCHYLSPRWLIGSERTPSQSVKDLNFYSARVGELLCAPKPENCFPCGYNHDKKGAQTDKITEKTSKLIRSLQKIMSAHAVAIGNGGFEVIEGYDAVALDQTPPLLQIDTGGDSNITKLGFKLYPSVFAAAEESGFHYDCKHLPICGLALNIVKRNNTDCPYYREGNSNITSGLAQTAYKFQIAPSGARWGQCVDSLLSSENEIPNPEYFSLKPIIFDLTGTGSLIKEDVVAELDHLEVHLKITLLDIPESMGFPYPVKSDFSASLHESTSLSQLRPGATTAHPKARVYTGKIHYQTSNKDNKSIDFTFTRGADGNETINPWWTPPNLYTPVRAHWSEVESDRLLAGESLKPGESIHSSNALHQLLLHENGKLEVVTKKHSSQGEPVTIWETNKGNSTSHVTEALLKPDCNLVLINTHDNTVVWESRTLPADDKTTEKNCFLELANSGRIVIYAADSVDEPAESSTILSYSALPNSDQSYEEEWILNQ